MKTMLITGGNEGIGFNMAKQWLENGYCVSVVDLNCDNIDKLKAAYPKNLLSFDCDVRDAESLKAAISQTYEQFGSVDYALNLTKGVLPVMKQQRKGRIYFTSSGVGVTGYTNISSYACSKGAIESLAKCLNIEYAGSGLSFHLLHPPLTNTRSSSPLPVPKEFKASPDKVGRGFFKHIDSKKFIIAPSFGDGISIRLTYLFPVTMGKLLVKLTNRAGSDLKKVQ